MTLSDDRDDLLHREAELLGRYLIGRVPAAELRSRYAAACRVHGVEGSSERERAVLGFVHRRPWSLPFLDAAAGLLAPRSLLRKRALLMTAVLEACPDHVERFLPRTVPAPLFPLLLGGHVLRALVKLVVGAALWPIASVVTAPESP